MAAEWAARLAGAMALLLAYWLAFRPAWPALAPLFYDIPTLTVVGSFGGAALLGLAAREADAPARLAVLAAVALIGAGVELRHWPLSGHLTAAVTVGLLEASSGRSPSWLRAAACAPVLVLILIRTLWPQTTLMGRGTYTVTAIAAGLAIALAANRLASLHPWR
jgi:hypothetical protein